MRIINSVSPPCIWRTKEFESDLKFLPPGPRDSAPDGKPTGDKPGNGGEEGEGGVAGHQELGQVDQESHGATEDVADTQPSGFNAILHFWWFYITWFYITSAEFIYCQLLRCGLPGLVSSIRAGRAFHLKGITSLTPALHWNRITKLLYGAVHIYYVSQNGGFVEHPRKLCGLT